VDLITKIFIASNSQMFKRIFYTLFIASVLFFHPKPTFADVFVKYIVHNGKIEIGNIFNEKNQRATFKVLKNEIDSFQTTISNTSLLSLWLSNDQDFKLVLLPLIEKDSILINVNSKRISISYINSAKDYRLRENVVNGWINGCSTLPLQKDSDPTKVQIEKSKKRWDCHYSNISNARMAADSADAAMQYFLKLYEAYGLINQEAAILRAHTLAGKRNRIGNDNFKRYFNLLGGAPLDENVMVHNALHSYFHILEKGGFERGDYRKILQHIDTLWKPSNAKTSFFQELMQSEWASGSLSEEISVIMDLNLPTIKQKIDTKATATNAPIMLPGGVISYQDSIAFSDGRIGNIDSLLTDTTSALKLVDFWASWCYPCRIAYKNTEALRKQISTMGVQIIYVSIDKLETSWKNANKDENLEATGVSVKLSDPSTANIVKQLMIFAIPRYLLFDKNGKLIKANMPGFKEPELLRTIEKYLQKTKHTK
jgi:thiol-disulfide isomerase/thioredoxin